MYEDFSCPSSKGQVESESECRNVGNNAGGREECRCVHFAQEFMHGAGLMLLLAGHEALGRVEAGMHTSRHGCSQVL